MNEPIKERWLYCLKHGWTPEAGKGCWLCKFDEAVNKLVADNQEPGLYERKETKTV